MLIFLNRDPHKLRTDAELISAMQRASLIGANGTDDTVEDKFMLDSIVSDEGEFSCHLRRFRLKLIYCHGRVEL